MEANDIRLNDISDKVNRMYSILVGQEEDENSGMIKKMKQVNDHLEYSDKRILDLEILVVKLKSSAWAFVATGSVIGFVVKEIIVYFSNK